MMDRIYTALDYAKRDGVKTVKDRIKKMQSQHSRRGMVVKVDFSTLGAGNVNARIWQGHWIADCPNCDGAEFVDPEEPIFFCWGCGNRAQKGKIYNVVFPDNREEIEKKTLERPVIAKFGLDDLSVAEGALPAISVDGKGLSRSWVPGETLDDLSNQQDKAIEAWKKAGRK